MKATLKYMTIARIATPFCLTPRASLASVSTYGSCLTIPAQEKTILRYLPPKRGEPCDQGARILAEEKRLPRIENATLGRAKIISDRNRYIIALIVKERESEV